MKTKEYSGSSSHICANEKVKQLLFKKFLLLIFNSNGWTKVNQGITTSGKNFQVFVDN